jgi:chromosome segregation ATPase|tara:strand:+ start:231 stop:443 length:213 start_codon:yes stop_codon:yes gene_type:complete
MDEISKIKDLIETLERRVRELETENHALKTAISSACNNLMRQNSEDRLLLEETENVITMPSFKPPKWKAK